ncbi:Sjogren's syndrome/scleroderma autoantigen 1 family protein [Candidatus Methanoliparum sp. LAM-1]|nr:Sjogren's syndrome/scleroderma autoantigen 1 family protein [Candidatus Methanoliparum sp. LAM-1]
MNEDEKITKISDMLIKGGKMLSAHCPSCGSPLFKKDDIIICPICETRFIEEKDLKDKDIKREEIQDRSDAKMENYIKKEIPKKILDIFKDLEEEKDFTKINMGLNCIKDLLNIIKILKEVKLIEK